MKIEKYLENNKIKENLAREELLKLKELLEKCQQKDLDKFTSRKKECYLWEVKKKLQEIKK